jgi:Xaa-Pro aminopeptidase
MEVWTGKRLGPERVKENLGIPQGHSIEEFSQKVGEYLASAETLYIDHQLFPETLANIQKIIPGLNRSKSSVRYPEKVDQLNRLLGPMRLIKEECEIEVMRKAQKIAERAHRLAMAKTRPGVHEYEIEAALQYVFRSEGAFGEAYHSIVAGGDNANILHYIENDQPLADGDLLLIDAGPELNYYAADITRTFPVNGKFSPEQKEVYEIVLESQKRAIEAVKVGESISSIHELSSKILIQGLKDLKVLDGPVDEIYNEGKHREFYPHGTSHWLGLDVHDLGPYRSEDKSQEVLFAENMVFTIEPGLYFAKDSDSSPDRLKGIGIRIEDNIRVTSQGFENLSSSIPREVSEVEEACAQDPSSLL